MTFTENDKLKALAIVHVFETSRPFGDYAACVVLNDGAGVSYGINQFTHRSGSLAAVIEAYLTSGGQIGREIFDVCLPALKRTTVYSINKLASDERFKKALRAAAVTIEMKEAQNRIAFEKYLRPAIRICEAMKLTQPLSLAVVYDSVTHGSWEWISRTVRSIPVSSSKADLSRSQEMSWITEYVRKRHFWLTNVKRLSSTSYRTKFFLSQIAIGNWDLRLPIVVHGVRLTDAMFPKADEPVVPEPEPHVPSFPPAAETTVLPSVNEAVVSAAEKFDRVDGVVTAITTRRDAAKSLWTTIAGSISQAAWAVFGFLIGLPRTVWIVVAVIAAALMLAYIYRQIELGRIRERQETRDTRQGGRANV